MVKIVAVFEMYREEERFVVPTSLLHKIAEHFEISPFLISKRYPKIRSGSWPKADSLSDARKVYWKWLNFEFGYSPNTISKIEGINHSTIYTALDKFHLVEEDYKIIFNEEEDNI